MQVLKESVKLRIIESAVDEFATHGYEKTSMAKIAEKAKVAVGNIYHYFKNKRELFYAVTTPVFERISNLIRRTHAPDFEDEEAIYTFMHRIGTVMSIIIRKHRREFYILLSGSKGTKYENTKERLVEMLETKILVEYRRQYRKRKVRIKEPFIVHIFATNMIEGYAQIIEHYRDEDWLENIISDFVTHTMTGYFAFFQDKK